MSWKHQSGTGDMGSASDESSIGRFIGDGPYRVRGAKARFPTGSGSATLTISVDSAKGPDFDYVLWTEDDIGAGGEDLNLRIAPDDTQWDIDEGDEIVFVWPDPGASGWSISIDLVPR